VRIEFFNEQMDRLRGLRFVPASLATHWEALSGMPEAALEAAVTRAGRTRSEFPTPVELRQDADQVAPPAAALELDRSEPLPEPVELGAVQVGGNEGALKLPPATRLWRYYCETCNDTGVQSLWCGANRRQPWLEIRECEAYHCKAIKHGHLEYGHEWMRPCVCAASNPAVRQKRERDAKYAPAPQRGVA
jgi:hypothetical protein